MICFALSAGCPRLTARGTKDFGAAIVALRQGYYFLYFGRNSTFILRTRVKKDLFLRAQPKNPILTLSYLQLPRKFRLADRLIDCLDITIPRIIGPGRSRCSMNIRPHRRVKTSNYYAD